MGKWQTMGKSDNEKKQWLFVTKEQSPSSTEKSVNWELWRNMTGYERYDIVKHGKAPKRLNLSKSDIKMMKQFYQRGY